MNATVLALRDNTQVVLFNGEILRPAALSALGHIPSQLLDRRIDMGRSNMRAEPVKRAQLLFKCRQNGLCAGIVRRRW